MEVEAFEQWMKQIKPTSAARHCQMQNILKNARSSAVAYALATMKP